MKFSEVIGQEEAQKRLIQMVEEGHLPHAMMLCGPQGSGKLALATAFACYLLERPTANGQQVSDSTKAMLAKLEHPDLHFTYPNHQTALDEHRAQARKRRLRKRVA